MTHTRSFVIRNELLLKNDVEKTVLRFLGHHRKHIKQRTERKSRIFVSFFLRVKIKKKKKTNKITLRPAVYVFRLYNEYLNRVINRSHNVIYMYELVNIFTVNYYVSCTVTSVDSFGERSVRVDGSQSEIVHVDGTYAKSKIVLSKIEIISNIMNVRTSPFHKWLRRDVPRRFWPVKRSKREAARTVFYVGVIRVSVHSWLIYIMRLQERSVAAFETSEDNKKNSSENNGIHPDWNVIANVPEHLYISCYLQLYSGPCSGVTMNSESRGRIPLSHLRENGLQPGNIFRGKGDYNSYIITYHDGIITTDS